jgi:hypothetical protein
MWMLFLGELRRRWPEYTLGTFAVALVIAALVTQRALARSAEDSVHDLAHRLGRNMLVLPASTDLGAFYGQRYGHDALPDSAPSTIRSSHIGQHIRLAEARLYANVDVNGVPVVLVGQDLGWPSMGDVEPAILGTAVARALGVEAGGLVRVGGTLFRVQQVASAPPDGLDTGMFVPLAAAQRALERPGEITALRLGGCWCRVDVSTLARDVERLLPGARAITVAGMVQAQRGTVAAVQRYSDLLLAAGAIVIALVVAALVASQARRRSQEIGLLVAIGASPRALAWLLTAQGALAGAIGGLAGWAAAVPASRAIGERLLGSSLLAPSGLLIPAVALAAAVSAVAAAFPARRAATLDPTVVLRET